MWAYHWKRTTRRRESYRADGWNDDLAEQSKKVSMNMSLRNLSWYITPILSVVLSFPTFLICLAFWTLVASEVIIKDTKGTLLLSAWNWLQPSLFAWFVLYIVFGPLFACMLCAVQLTRSQQEGTLVGLASSHMYRLTRAVLLFAAVSICLLILTGGIARIIRGPTWSESLGWFSFSISGEMALVNGIS
jgi:hypothetical protein